MKDKNTITLNGKISTQITGLLIQELPPISKPLLRSEKEEIDGRDGDIVTALGYSAYDKEISVGVYGDYDINQIIAYFNSEGVVTFSNEPDKYYNYQIIQQIDFERLVRYRTATVTFHCQPFKYSTTEGEEILDPPAQNLLSIPDFNKTTNGVTLTVADGVISVSGTPSAATEFYVPTGGLSLSAGTFTLSAQANGTGVTAASIRLIGSVPSDSDSLGGNYVALKNGQTVSIKGTLSATKNFGYLWFYITTGSALDFTMTAKVEDEAEKVASDEGTALMLLNTPEAPFNKFDLKGNTYQQTYSGKNLWKPASNGTQTQGGITSVREDGTITLTGTSTSTSTGTSPFYDLDTPLPAGTYTYSIKNALPYRLEFVMQDSNGTNHFPVIVAGSTSGTITTTWETVKIRNGIGGYTAGTEINVTIEELQLEAGSTATDYEPYVGGIPAPNPDYPQEVLNVKHQNMIRLTGKNLVSADELYLSASVERTSDGLRKTIESRINAFYYSSSVANPIGIYTVSFEGRISNIAEATLVLEPRAYIWGYNNLTLKDKDGNAADEVYRTLGSNWKKYSFTVTAYTSAQWTTDKAMYLYFSTYTNSPVFELRNFQIEAGVNATEFDGNAPQMYPIDFRIGKNMLSTDFLTMGRLLNSGSVNTAIKYQINTALSPLKVSPNTTYTISANLGETVKGMRLFVQECDVNTVPLNNINWIQLASEAYTFTTRGDTEYIKLGFGLSTTSATVNDSTEDTTEFSSVNEWLRGTTLQVEEGNTATAYEPYESIELCKIGDYQDNIRKLGDDWYVHKEIGKYTFTGSESWGEQSNYNTDNRMLFGFNATNAISGDNIADRTGISNNFIFTQVQSPSIDVTGFYFNRSANYSKWIYAKIQRSLLPTENVTGFKNWLANNNMTVYYQMSPATETKITNPTTIATLEAMKNNAHAYKGVTFVSSLPGGVSSLQLISSVEVIKSSDGVVTNAGNFISKPKLTVYGSGDIGISINGVQVFQIALGDEDYITIDTAAMEAYQDSTENLKNRLVTGDYDNFYLNPGDNQITFSGVVTQCIVENYSRWLQEVIEMTTNGLYYYTKDEVDDLISGGGGSGTGAFMTKAVYDTDNDGIVDNAEKVNGKTVLSDVPANAVFTDTTYTAGTGISITNGVISCTFADGDGVQY